MFKKKKVFLKHFVLRIKYKKQSFLMCVVLWSFYSNSFKQPIVVRTNYKQIKENKFDFMLDHFDRLYLYVHKFPNFKQCFWNLYFRGNFVSKIIFRPNFFAFTDSTALYDQIVLNNINLFPFICFFLIPVRFKNRIKITDFKQSNRNVVSFI